MVDKQTLNPLISLSSDKIRGAQRTSVYGISYLSFEGIPYGQPPVGELRFKSPQPALPWKGIKNCSENPPIPLQKNFETSEVMGSEDCLNLNVYMNQLAPAKRLPVLVWIFGGGFYMGQANRKYYSPDYFLDRDVIVVTINYRVCSLGFLSVKDPKMQIPGNAGLKDQVLALKWIKHNIAYFNGDPQNVTLFGISSGAACVHYHLIMDLSKGLFHKAICMGGSALSPWACVLAGITLLISPNFMVMQVSTMIAR
uniref:carboxylesterase n=1 Tax=Stomoxys calcitrans TaxID=35570 RepID=A0A1I8QEL7_STOCA